MPVPRPHASAPEVLLVILTDLSVDHRCHKWARSLRDAGYHPVILCDRPLHPLGRAWDGFDIRVVTRRSHLQGFLPAFAEFLLRLVPHLVRSRARVFVSLDAPPLFWVALWGRLLGRAVTYDSHELYLETPLVQGRPGRRRFWTAWENAGFALLRRCVTVSPAIRDRLQARHPRVRFHVLPNMPLQDPDAPRRAELPPDADGPVRLVFQGGLRVATGLPELFLALRDRPALRACTLDVYGGGPEAEALRAAAAAAGVERRVVFHGSVPFEELPEKMARADVGIHLMQPVCGSFALTWANKTFDYAHAGLPVLLSDNPAHRALLAEHPVGVLADSFSPEAIGVALEALLRDYARHAAAARAAAREWHWDAYFRDVPRFLGLA